MGGNLTLSLGALLAVTVVGLGAYAAHGLENQLIGWGYEEDIAQRLEWFDTAVKYQMFHALAIFAIGLSTISSSPERCLRIAVLLFLVGLLLFCGSLYAIALAPPTWRKLGAVVPLGGFSFIVGWLAAAYGGWRIKATPP